MLIVNTIGILLIALIIWWFWLYKPKVSDVSNGDISIEVENGVYVPSNIKIPADQRANIQFLRKDPSPCAETVLIPELGINESLPLNKVKSISLPSLKSGTYDFYCQLQMYRGKIVVE